MRRTDLAAEARELWGEGRTAEALPEGVEADSGIRNGCRLERLHIRTAAGAAALGKPVGEYVTVTPEALLRREEGSFGETAALLASCLRRLLQPEPGGSVLVAGLGNEAVTPDALGPRAMRHVLATRHLVDALPAQFGSFRRVSAVTPGVTGNTGFESAELLRSLVRELRPCAVVTVDALAARRLGRVCRTVQLTDTGVTPGSGVGNARQALNRETLGVPVVAIGVPTVVDAGTLVSDLAELANIGTFDSADLGGFGQDMILTPREIDAQIQELSRLIGYAIDMALQDGLTAADVTALIG